MTGWVMNGLTWLSLTGRRRLKSHITIFELVQGHETHVTETFNAGHGGGLDKKGLGLHRRKRA